jgi:hypothetical protein
MEGPRAREAFAFDQLRTTCFAIALPSSEMNCGGDLQIHLTGILKLPEDPPLFPYRRQTGNYAIVVEK